MRLTDVAKTSSGGTPSRGRAEFYGGSIPWVKSGELRDRIVYETEESISEEGLASSSAKLFPKGTVCIALYGATVGRLGILGTDAATNQAVCGIFPGPEIDPKYLYRFLESRRPDLIGHGKGGAQSNISQAIVREIELPLPSVTEQHRIVAEIEKQFTRLEAAVTSLKRAQANMKRYRAIIFKAACEGRLVLTQAHLSRHEQREFEPAHVLIARTPVPSRPNRWNSRSSDVIHGHSALAVGNPRTELPEGWTWSPLVDIAKMESGHTPSRAHPEWWSGDIPWIGIADAREHHGRIILQTNQQTNTAGLANSASRLLPAGTVCVSRTASVGYVTVMGRAMATSQDFVNWIPTPAVTSGWLRVVFCADRKALQSFGKGSVHKTIYFPEWLSMWVAVPPLTEQERIVAEVERRLSVIDELEELAAANVRRAARLRQSILERAFSGRLVKSNVKVGSSVRNRTTSPASRRHFLRVLLSAEIVHQLHAEPTFGQVKHQKIFHLCEHIAQISELDVQYHRDAAGPYDNRLIHANEADLKRLKWYEQYSRPKVGHGYRPLPKAGDHEKYLQRYWPEKVETIRRLIHLMRRWDTEGCEIFSTAYAAWNDLLLWGQEATEDAIVHEVLYRWHKNKQRIPEARWRKALEWMKKEGFVPTGFGKPTAAPEPS